MASRMRSHLLLAALHGLEYDCSTWNTSAWKPRVDVYELADAVLIQVEAPGLRVEALQLSFEPGELLVEGTRERPALPDSARAALVEMNYGPFRRRFALPSDVNGDGIKATYEAGILQIVVPRQQVSPHLLDVTVLIVSPTKS